ncbi:MAG: EFR1 family ferrodoxin [Clostridia bacterium]|nr:EFR1 family ferrodoxin [Clostridia bacterium]
MKKTQIFYFTGSGNSLVVAEETAKRIRNTELIEISSALEKEHLKTNANTIGFVFPCHGLTIPIPVKRFLQQLSMKKALYIFAVCTRGGSAFIGFDTISKILKKKHKHLNASFIIDMPNNDPKVKDYNEVTYKDIELFHKNMHQKLDLLESVIAAKEEYEDNIEGERISKNKAVNKLLEWLVPFALHNAAPKVSRYFYAGDDCIGCSTCEKICPSHKISLKDSKPVWDNKKDCYMCYACLNYCPIETIQINSKFYMKSYTKDHGRYHHPEITAQDMMDR